MDLLGRAAETRVGHEQTAGRPFRLGPSVPSLVDPEQVDVPVQVALQVLRVHAREPPQMALQPRAQVVDERHALQAHRVADVDPAGLVGSLHGPHQGVVRLPLVSNDGRALRHVGLKPIPDALGRGLAVPAHHRDRVLVHVDRDGHAELLPGQAPLPRLAAAVREVRVAGVGLVNPDPVPEHDAPLAAVDRREDAVAPLPGGLVRHPACLRRRARRHAEPHEADEADPGRKLFPAALEHGSRERVEPRTAAPAPAPLQPRLAPAVPGRLCRAAARARGVRSVECGGLGVGAESALVAAAPLVHRRGELGELVVSHSGHARRAGVLLGHGDSRPPKRPPDRELSPNKETRWAPRQFLCWRDDGITGPPEPRPGITRYLDC